MDGAYLFVAADDGSLPLRSGETAAGVLLQRRELELHSYHASIAHLTFRTRFVPVSEVAAEAWRVWNRGGDVESLPSEQREALRVLRAEVDACVREVAAGNGRAFVRLSTRSPKDAVSLIPRLRERMVATLRDRLFPRRRNGATGMPDYNAQLCALDACMGELMSVCDGAQAFELVMHSERCVSDLRRMLEYREALPAWDLQIIVREFVPLPPSSEYRCFVHGGELCAVSQYFASSYYASVAAGAAATLKRIEQFFEQQCKNAIELEDYVLDLAVMPEGDGEEEGRAVWVIELNPYSPTTGACLFDWEVDAATLAHPPVEIRVVTEPGRNLDVLLMPWQRVLSEALAPATTVQDDDRGSKRCAVM